MSKNLVAREVKDGDVISLIRKFLASGAVVNEQLEAPPLGLAQGGPISPILSNIMLNELDQELKKRGPHFVRYADDVVIFVKSDFSARRVKKSVTRFIEDILGLQVNATKSRITKPNDPHFKYLGFGFYWDELGENYKAKLHPVSLASCKHKLHILSKRKCSVSLDYRIAKINQVVRGWVTTSK
ncbi:reverse transcriptase domain-containing protein [Lactococcus garvieae]|uniref:reverse transcriptase domain-containing protein n=1 Tax=Lactococcus garvieae TaxID=1363 RepID=UPI0038553B48